MNAGRSLHRQPEPLEKRLPHQRAPGDVGTGFESLPRPMSNTSRLRTRRILTPNITRTFRAEDRGPEQEVVPRAALWTLKVPRAALWTLKVPRAALWTLKVPRAALWTLKVPRAALWTLKVPRAALWTLKVPRAALWTLKVPRAAL
ncbi:hypothetical protein NHX12_022547 [Muraenolepis orangiensis]|uniref:Uncharacterized protein n=1 Tax=Muraenolepis orangiensis TaxID=630683 RepID=A0A9Q0ENF4_9TELE|nr:hypothetical protein NHX12_022547 [Muraenolepis orangiensis]